MAADAGGRPDADEAGAPGGPLLVSTGEAARIAEVNTRTVRRWIERGYLPAEQGPGGAVVSPADLPRAQARAAEAAGGRPPAKRSGARPGVRTDDPGTPPEPDRRAPDRAPAAMAAAQSQLEAIRDQWLQPLVAQIREQAEETGRLRAERDAAVSERDALRAELERVRAGAEQDTPSARQEAPGAAERAAPDADAPRSWWARWVRRLTEGP